MEFQTDSQGLKGQAMKSLELTAQEVIGYKEVLQRQTEFLTMLSHEVRAPLSSILGYLEILTDELEKTGNHTVDDLLERLSHNVRMLRFLIINYLDFHNLDMKPLKLDRQSLQLNALLQHVLQDHEPEAKRSQITLQGQFQEPLPLLIGDKMALERVIGNLLYNALKFTPEGGIVTLSSRLDGDAVCVAVTDTGPGIAVEEAAALFEKYYQAPATASLAGCGLGLYIVKKFVDAHEGRISVTNTPPAGSCFQVWLPLGEE